VVLVNLVEDQELDRGKLPLQDSLAVLGDVPVEVAAGRLAEECPGEGGLAHLPGPADEDHLAAEIPADLGGQVSIDGGGHAVSIRVFLPMNKKTRECLDPMEKNKPVVATA